MKIGIIGLPNSGKTTVFNALTKNDVQTGSFMTSGREHHLGRVIVPDERFGKLVEYYKPKKESPATIEFVDVAGISKGSSSDAVSNELLQFIRDVDALLHVVRVFKDKQVMHVDDTIDPVRDIETLENELILNDLIIIDKRLEKLRGDLNKYPADQKKKFLAEKEVLEKMHGILEEEEPLRDTEFTEQELKAVSSFDFLSLKPMMILLNIGEEDLGNEEQYLNDPKLQNTIGDMPVITFCGQIEAELAQLDKEDAAIFMEDLGIEESSLDKVIRTAYDMLGLLNFFTAGDKEVHTWTIRKGKNTALEAAGKIHTDMARGFIRAEVVSFEDLKAADGSWSTAKEMGNFHLVGKDHEINDGDILVIRFNV